MSPNLEFIVVRSLPLFDSRSGHDSRVCSTFYTPLSPSEIEKRLASCGMSQPGQR